MNPVSFLPLPGLKRLISARIPVMLLRLTISALVVVEVLDISRCATLTGGLEELHGKIKDIEEKFDENIKQLASEIETEKRWRLKLGKAREKMESFEADLVSLGVRSNTFESVFGVVRNATLADFKVLARTLREEKEERVRTEAKLLQSCCPENMATCLDVGLVNRSLAKLRNELSDVVRRVSTFIENCQRPGDDKMGLSTEAMVVSLPANTCKSGFFMCDTGVCIPHTWICDDVEDCIDGSDENNCDIPVECESNFIQCDSRCIPKIWQCDGDRDCADGKDEKDCVLKCSEKEKRCNSSNTCIHSNWWCDGDIDCADGSDESACP